jgi:hypothetical protein
MEWPLNNPQITESSEPDELDSAGREAGQAGVAGQAKLSAVKVNLTAGNQRTVLRLGQKKSKTNVHATIIARPEKRR